MKDQDLLEATRTVGAVEQWYVGKGTMSEHIRLVILGGQSVGKSCIVKRFIFGNYTDRYKSTVEDLYSREYDLGPVTLKVCGYNSTSGYSLDPNTGLPFGDQLHRTSMTTLFFANTNESNTTGTQAKVLIYLFGNSWNYDFNVHSKVDREHSTRSNSEVVHRYFYWHFRCVEVAKSTARRCTVMKT